MHRHVFVMYPTFIPQAANQVRKLYKMFIDVDATQIEVNPLGETDDGRGNASTYNIPWARCLF